MSYTTSLESASSKFLKGIKSVLLHINQQFRSNVERPVLQFGHARFSLLHMEEIELQLLLTTKMTYTKATYNAHSFFKYIFIVEKQSHKIPHSYT